MPGKFHRHPSAGELASLKAPNIVPLRPDSVADLLHDYHTTLEDIALDQRGLLPEFHIAISGLDDRYRTWRDTQPGDAAS